LQDTLIALQDYWRQLSANSTIVACRTANPTSFLCDVVGSASLLSATAIFWRIAISSHAVSVEHNKAVGTPTSKADAGTLCQGALGLQSPASGLAALCHPKYHHDTKRPPTPLTYISLTVNGQPPAPCLKRFPHTRTRHRRASRRKKRRGRPNHGRPSVDSRTRSAAVTLVRSTDARNPDDNATFLRTTATLAADALPRPAPVSTPPSQIPTPAKGTPSTSRPPQHTMPITASHTLSPRALLQPKPRR